MTELKRYQECSWPVRLFRRLRYDWRIPIDAIYFFLQDDDECMSRYDRWRFAWGCARGFADARKEHWYALGEFRGNR